MANSEIPRLVDSTLLMVWILVHKAWTFAMSQRIYSLAEDWGSAISELR
ncbi:hypothetical protein GXM_01101 [Nostoc sphaeroides CCNUC1]|uniref:Uncharacterized protein n=1 Tax=Nostoc sphaeroides CCNUC1 TaxID=2653204 RepID=A0A5P8VT57_9NOSO|nr:hypothetical protein GXM_01101 [Nostoc sphaeroides CCNUC1]